VVGVLFRVGERRKDRPLVPSNPVWGVNYVTVELAGFRLRFSADSFMQANLAAAKLLIDVVRESAEIQEGMTVIDLYSGTGLFALVAAEDGATVYAVENSPAAVEDARANLREKPDVYSVTCKEASRQPDVTVLHSPAARGLQLLYKRGARAGVVILDPPRSGCDRTTLRWLTAMSPRRVVYISCDPATQARDMSLLAAGGYRVRSIKPIDFFPQTYHVETVAVIEAPAGS